MTIRKVTDNNLCQSHRTPYSRCGIPRGYFECNPFSEAMPLDSVYLGWPSKLGHLVMKP